MNKKTKLLTALQHIESIAKLMEGNKYQQHIRRNLSPIHAELNRQLKLEKDNSDEVL